MKYLLSTATLCIALVMVLPSLVSAHCDTIDGPVVIDAKAALAKSDVTPILKWVKKDNEQEIKQAFQKTLAVRTKGPEAKQLADTYFFETLVRVHRAGEGAAYTGLKPAGTEIEPALAAADKAVDKGSADDLIKAMTQHIADGVRKRFEEVTEKKKTAGASPAAGREYVAAYVEFIHYVEGLHQMAIGAAHHEESAAGHKEAKTEHAHVE